MLISLLLMIFLHIVDDYYLQGVLASMKQKTWWKDKYNYYWKICYKKYRFDYLAALFMHSFSWSFMIMIPTMISGCFIWWLFLLNLVIHFVVDHLKANLQKINLVTDQSIHILQIVLTWLICFVV
jgi:hypothetical protein